MSMVLSWVVFSMDTYDGKADNWDDGDAMVLSWMVFRMGTYA